MATVPADDAMIGAIVQEANRRFFHTIGINLVLKGTTDDGAFVFDFIDERQGPVGPSFSYEQLNDAGFIANANAVREMFRARIPERKSALGGWIQPVAE